VRYVDEEGTGVAWAALADPDAEGWEEAEALGRWLVARGARVTPVTKSKLEELEAFRKSRHRIVENRKKHPGRNKGRKYFAVHVETILFCINAWPESKIESYEWDHGIRLAGRFPKKARMRFMSFGRKKTAFDPAAVLHDFLNNTLGAWIVSKRTRDLLAGLGAKSFEWLPVEILDPDGKSLSAGYGVLNPLGGQDLIDLDRSRVRRSSAFPDQIDHVEKLALDRPNVDEDAIVFRASRMMGQLFVRDDVKKAFEKERITGATLVDAEKWDGATLF
jgi:hypothetical protein